MKNYYNYLLSKTKDYKFLLLLAFLLGVVNVGWGQNANVEISAAASGVSNGAWTFSGGVYTFTPSANSAVVSRGDIQTRLVSGVAPNAAGSVRILTACASCNQTGNVIQASTATITAATTSTTQWTFTITAGGSVTISEAINLTAAQGTTFPGTNVVLTSGSSGSITVSAAITTIGSAGLGTGGGSQGGNGGAITLTSGSTSGNITISAALNASGGVSTKNGATNGGNITVNAQAGSVSIITAGITTNGTVPGSTNLVGGSAGIISITGFNGISCTQNLTATGGAGAGSGAGGTGGNITLNSSSGSILLSGSLNSSGGTGGGTGGAGGAISITGSTGITCNQNITAIGGAGGGNGDNGGIGGNITFNDGSTTVTTGGGINDGISGIINNSGGASGGGSGAAGTNGSVTKSGSGTLVLSGTNTYNGATNITAGVLNIQNASALGTTTSGTTVSSGAALQLQGAAIGAETLNLSGTGVSANGALRFISGTNSWAGLITLATASRINADGGTNTIDVVTGNAITGTFNLSIGGSGNLTIADPIATSTGTLTKDGSGTLTLSGANTFTGGTTITAGILRFGAAGVLADAGTITLNGGTLSTGATTGFNETVGTLNISANSTIALGTGAHTLTFAASNGVSWTASRTLTITGWTGAGSATGTAGKIFFGSANTGLTATQLGVTSFTGYSTAAMMLATGECVPMLPTCSGTPNPGTATISSQTGCSGLTVTLSTVGADVMSGLTYQWEKSTNEAFTSPINLGASTTTSASSRTDAPTVNTFYRLKVDCSGGSPVYSNLVSFSVITFPSYCSFTGITTIEPITNVTFAGINNSTSATVGGTPAVEDFSCSIAPGDVVPGNSYAISLSGNTAGNFTCFFTVYFDWNQNGDFNDAGESYQEGTINNCPNCAITNPPNILVPITAKGGFTRMRVVKNFGAYPNSSCAAQSAFGQVEDYTIKVCTISAAPTGASATVTNGCSGASTTLTQTGGTLGDGASWKWYTGSCGGTLVNTNTNADASFTTTISAGATYFVRAEGGTCSNTTACGSVAITLTGAPGCATSQIPLNNEINQNPAGFNLSWATGSPTATSYDIYFGTDGGGVSTPTNIVNGVNQLGTTYATGTLAPNTIYYWKIVPRNCSGSQAASGCPIFTFTTAAAACTPPSFTTSTENVACFGNSTGSITVNATGGVSPYTYSINGGSYTSSNLFSGLSAGTYAIRVKGNDECASNPADVTITQPVSELVANAGSNISTCSGASNVIGGEPTASGGTGTYTYSWSPATGLSATNVPNPTATVTSNTTYTLTVTDANGCTANSSITITISTGITKYWYGSGSSYPGAGTGTNFNDPNNWSSSNTSKVATSVPSSCDDVVYLTVAGSSSLSSNTSIKSLSMSHSGNNNVFTIGSGSNTLTILQSTTATTTSGNNSTDLIFDCGTGAIIFGGNADFSGNYNVPIYSSTNGSGIINFRGNVSLLLGAWEFTTNLPSKVIFDGTTAQTITISAAQTNWDFPSVEIGNGTSASFVTFAGTQTCRIVSNLTVKANATLDLSTRTLNRSAAGGTFAMEAGSTLRLNAATGGQTGSNFPLNFSTMTLHPTSTVEYYSGNGVNQTIFATPTYGNLRLTNVSFSSPGSGATTKTAGGAVTVAGNLDIGGNTTFNAGTSLTHNLAGNWTNNGTFTFTTGNTINLNGTTLQTLGGNNSTTFGNLTLNNSTGGTLAINQIVNAALTLTSGGLLLNGRTLTYSGTALTRSTGSIKADDTNSEISFQNGSPLTLPASVFQNATVYNMTVNGAGGTTLGSDTTISNQLQLTTGNLNIGANVLTLSGPYITGTPNNLKSISGSTVNFNNSGSGTFNLPNFADINTLNFNNNLTLTAASNISVSGNLSITSGIVDLQGFTANRTTAGGTLTLGANGQLKIGGTNTFPSNYNTHSINPASTVEYSGTNQNVTKLNSLQNYGYLILSGTGNKTFDDLVTIENNLTNSNTSTATLTTGKSLIIKNQLINNGIADNFVFENNSSLVQINNVSNTGSIKYNRTSPLTVNTTDYVYWSAPVNNNTVSSGLNYYWDNAAGTTGNWIGANGQSMTAGRGFIFRGIGSRAFSGVPYNGEVTVNVFRRAIVGFDDNWNLIGNPYASAISADEFIADPDNSSIEGSVSIWTHGSPISSSNPNPFYATFTYNYNPNDYIVYNSFASQSGPSTFNGFIAAGQAFFVKMDDGATATSNTVKFKNSMRTDASNAPYNNSQFYRNNSENSNNEIEKHRIWLDIVNSNSLCYRTTLGYATNATDNKDRIYDAYSNFNSSDMSIYSLIGNEKVAIKADALPFDVNDTFQLGYNAPQAGNYSIAIHALDGLFENQDVYIEDLQLNIFHNLKLNPYHFNSAVGNFENRFVLKFNNETLGNNDFAFDNVKVYTNESINVSAPNQVIKSIRVHDLLGRVLGTFNNVNSDSFSSKNIAKTQSPLLIEVTLENGINKTYKVIF